MCFFWWFFVSSFESFVESILQSKHRTEPMELGREPNAANLFENESLSNSVHLQQLLGLAPPVTSSITPNLNDLSKSLLSIFTSNTSPTSSMLISPKSQSNFLPRQNDTSKNCMNTSNDDSESSQSGTCNGDDVGSGKQQNTTRYRRRKPQKTVRMSNEMDISDTTLNSEKNNAIKNDCHKTDSTNNSNGINFPSFHPEINNSLSQANTITTLPPPLPPQTQSMDLSHHCTNQGIFENGLVNYSKSNDMDVTNSSTAVERSDKDATNLLANDDMNGMNLFGTVNFSHMRGANLTNDIATFPNTDDLVKKVEELVKCNEQNGFDSNDFGPMELTKPHANKLIADTYENNRMANGICDTIKNSNNIEPIDNNHSGTVNCNGNGNGNGIIPGILNDKIENKSHESNHTDMETSNATIVSNSKQNCEIPTASNSSDSEKTTEAQISSDIVYEKLNGDINNQTNIDASVTIAPPKNNDIANNTLNETTAKFNSNEVAKGSMCASSSESPASNASPTPKKKTVTKKKQPNNRCNGKSIGNKSNQKNAKTNDKSEKKSDIKKTKSKDDSQTDVLNKFRGPYVHVERDGSVDVINAPLNEEIAEKQSKFKKSYISQRPADRNRVRGLHVSTLSNKYDAVTTDISWMCVFCKLGPHKYGLGDLFGPFILSTESEDFQLAQIDPKQDVFKSNRNITNMAAASQNISSIAAKSLSKQGNAGHVSYLFSYEL